MVVSNKDKQPGSTHLNRMWVILVIVVLVIAAFVFFSSQDSEFVGQAIAPSIETNNYCGDQGLVVGSTAWPLRSILCISDTKLVECTADNKDYVKNVGGDSFLCTAGSNYADWRGCDSKNNGLATASKQHKGPLTKGVVGKNLCINDNWYECPNREDTGDAAFSRVVEDYLCGENSWFICKVSVTNSQTVDGTTYKCVYDDGLYSWQGCGANDEFGFGAGVSKLCIKGDIKTCEASVITEGKHFCALDANDNWRWWICGSNKLFRTGSHPNLLCDNGNFDKCTTISQTNGPYFCAKNSETDQLQWWKCSGEKTYTLGGGAGNLLCDKGSFLKCKSQDFIHENAKYACDGSAQQWRVCDVEFNLKATGPALCVDEKWVDCTEQGKVYGNRYCILSDTGDLWNKCAVGDNGPVVELANLYCQKGDIKTCQGSTNEVTENEKYLCENNEWQECSQFILVGQPKAKNADNTLYCNSGKWTACTNNMQNEFSTGNDYICQNGVWNDVPASAITPPDGYEWTKDPLKTSDVGDEVVAGDQASDEEDFLDALNENLENLDSDLTPTAIQKKLNWGGVTVVVKVKKLYWCPPNYCPNKEFPGAPVGDYCYAPKSVFDSFSLCAEEDQSGVWYICDDTIVDVDETLHNNQFLCVPEFGWDKCDQKGLSSKSQFYCENDVWVECTADNLDATINGDQYTCRKDDGEYHWWAIFNLGVTDLFEGNIVKGASAFKFITKTDDTGEVVEKVYPFISLCDVETDLSLNQATVCYTENSGLVQRVVDSTPSIVGDSTKEFEKDTETNLMFLYDALYSPKIVKLILVKEINVPLNLPKGNFEKNFVEGRRIVLQTGFGDNAEYYLLSRDSLNPLFSVSQLTLQHLGTGTEFVIQKLQGEQYQFEVFKDEIITLFEDAAESIIITMTASKVLAAGQAIPYNLDSRYEVNFNKETPIKLADYGQTIVAVCLDDEDQDPEILLICSDETGTMKEAFDLKRNELTKKTIGGKELAFLYLLENGVKQAYVFHLEGLSIDEAGLKYHDFIKNVLAGRRVAFEFEEELSLLEHPLNQQDTEDISDEQAEGLVTFLSLPSMTLTTHKGLDENDQELSTIYPLSGSSKKVQSLIPEGRITISRDIKTPPPPFLVLGENKQQIIDTPINLDEELFTSVSTLFPVKITTPNWGILSVSDADVKQLENQFWLDSSLGLQPHLGLNTPHAVDDILFYYYDASVNEGNYVKTAKIYKLYKLSNQIGELGHLFSDDLIDTFKSGSALALQLEDEFFELSYTGPTGGFFNIEHFQLSSMDGETIFPGVLNNLELTMTFSLSTEQKIIVRLELPAEVNADKVIYFSSSDVQTLDALTFDGDTHMVTVTKENSVDLEGDNYRMCDTGSTASKSSLVLLCNNSQQFKLLNLTNPVMFLGDYLLWYRGNKEITVHQIETIQDNGNIIVDWGETYLPNIGEGKSKAFFWKDMYFEIVSFASPVNLSSISFYTIPAKVQYPIINPKISPIELESGAITYGEHVLSLYENFDPSFNTQLNILPLEGLLLTPEGLNVTGTASFVPAPGAPVYQAKVAKMGNLVKLTISDQGAVIYIGTLPKGISTEILLPSGEVVGIEVFEFDPPLIIIK